MSALVLFDDHIHSRLSSDGKDTVDDLCRAALERGLSGICITDHFDTDPTDYGYGAYDFDRLLREVEAARRRYGGQLELRIGAEICFQVEFAPRVEAFLRACAPDFVLGSAHYVRREFVDSAYFRRRRPYDAYEGYLGAVEEVVASGLFDSLGHLDLAKRYGARVYGAFDPEPHEERIERILRLLVRQGMALEVNTSGWRQAPGEPFPGEHILRRYAQLGGERITIGSDAHQAADVGCDVARAYALARRAGLTQVTRFAQRSPESFPLPHVCPDLSTSSTLARG